MDNSNFKLGKAFIVIVIIATAILTVLCINNKGFSFTTKEGYLVEDAMLQSKGGQDIYYACKGEDVIVSQSFDDGTCFVSINDKIGYINKNAVSFDDIEILSICKGTGVNQGIIKEVNKQLLIVPEDMRDLFINSGWSMVVTSEDLNEKYYNGEFREVLGSTSYENSEISISDSLQAADDATLHEFGHWVDWYLNSPSDSEVFKEIYKKEQENFYSKFNLPMHWNEKEFFAEAFDRFYTDRIRLEKIAPELYSYMAFALHGLS